MLGEISIISKGNEDDLYLKKVGYLIYKIIWGVDITK